MEIGSTTEYTPGFNFTTPLIEITPSLIPEKQTGKIAVYLIYDSGQKDRFPEINIENTTLIGNKEVENTISQYIKNQLGIRKEGKVNTPKGNLLKSVDDEAGFVKALTEYSGQDYGCFFVTTSVEKAGLRSYRLRSRVTGPVIGSENIKRSLETIFIGQSVREEKGVPRENKLVLIYSPNTQPGKE